MPYFRNVCMVTSETIQLFRIPDSDSYLDMIHNLTCCTKQSCETRLTCKAGSIVFMASVLFTVRRA